MSNKKQQLKELKGEKVTIYTIEKEFTGTLRQLGSEFSIANATSYSLETVIIKPSDIVDVKRLTTMPIIFVHNHFVF